ncbi:MAG: OsmC family protein [Chthoniobacterales bacterium]|jgi:putative redox protein
MVNISIRYEGGLRCEAVHGPSGQRLLTDAPIDNHGKGEAFSPTDLVATALGTCMATVMGIVAERHALDLTGMKIGVTKEMSKDTPRRIARLTTVIAVPLPPDHPDREILERAALTCPVHQSLHPGIEKPLEFRWSK